MLKSLYEGFVNLYSEILSENPSLASDHALAQEQEVYEKSTKLTYRNVSHVVPLPSISDFPGSFRQSFHRSRH